MTTDTARGTGRTYRQLQGLPDGSVFIVHHRNITPHIKGLLVQMGRRSDALRITSWEDAEPVLIGFAVPGVRIDIDHSVYDLLPALQGRRGDQLRRVVNMAKLLTMREKEPTA